MATRKHTRSTKSAASAAATDRSREIQAAIRLATASLDTCIVAMESEGDETLTPEDIAVVLAGVENQLTEMVPDEYWPEDLFRAFSVVTCVRLALGDDANQYPCNSVSDHPAASSLGLAVELLQRAKWSAGAGVQS